MQKLLYLEPVFTTTSQHPPERCASQASTLSNNHDICRICHCEGDSEVPLIAPCYCAGSLRFVHQACLQQWIKSSDIRSCELCKFQFIMQSKIKPFSEWETLEMSGVERRKLLCSVTFHAVALTCVVWSLYVLIDRTAEEIQRGLLEWPFWTKLIVVAIGFTGSLVFMYIQCKAYLHLCRRWKAFNRVIFVQNAPEKVALPTPNSQPPLAREESLLVSETCCGVVTSDDVGRGKRRGNELSSATTVDSAFHEGRRKSSSKNKSEERHEKSIAAAAADNLLLTRADYGNEDVLKRVTVVDNGNNYQHFVSKSRDGCDIGDLKDSSIQDSVANASSRKYSYDEPSHILADSNLTGNECEEMSHLLQDDRHCESVRRIGGSHQSSSGFVFLSSTLPPPLTRQVDTEVRGKFREINIPNTSTSCAVSSSSSEESFHSPSIQLLQQNRKSLNGAGLPLKQPQQQAPTLPARPWTVGPSNSAVTWVTDVASERTTGLPTAAVRVKSSLGSQSPLLSITAGNEDPANEK
ncbi:uncharacterized protein [Periplaneta americana]|uniref:uncharacterized protein isoform X2 n=1 Tax=Periplaneta americana TaxID=6978 RepID=UPI0037E7C872